MKLPFLSNLDHPNIVRVYDERVLEESGRRFLYMQYVAGGSLKQVMERLRDTDPMSRCGRDVYESLQSPDDDLSETTPGLTGKRLSLPTPIGTSVVCWIGARLADALSYAHHRGYLHRDVKPANILMTTHAWPLLADFNLSFGATVEGADAGETLWR